MKPPFECRYDEEADCLYVTGSDNRTATGTHLGENILARWAMDTGELVGLTLWDVSKIKNIGVSEDQMKKWKWG